MSPTHLPRQLSSFIGRETEIAEINALLCDSACQLLTLLGLGGSGKTRLAIETAAALEHNFADGVFFVALQPLSVAEEIVPAMADALGLQLFGAADPVQQLLDDLRDKQVLLLLDNFEHLIEGAPLLLDILQATPQVKLLVTSREALKLEGEWLRHLDGLSYPEPDAAPDDSAYSAVQLFAERARRVRGDFRLQAEQPHVIRICQLVEGMPLAIELAASWLRVLSCADVAREIERSLDLLAREQSRFAERHRGMRAVFNPTWNMLSERERQVFRQLSVFRGGFEREAAEAVAGASLDVLAGLVDKALLRMNSAGRYDIHELLRQYSEEKLRAAANELELVENRHMAYFADFLQRSESTLKGPQPIAALDAIERDMANIMRAWGHALNIRRVDETRRMLVSFGLYFRMRSRFHESLTVFARARQQLADVDKVLYVRLSLLLARSELYHDVQAGFELAQQAWTVWREHAVPGEAAFELAAAVLHLLIQDWSDEDADDYWRLHQVLMDDLAACRQKVIPGAKAGRSTRWAACSAASGDIETAHDYFSQSVGIFRQQNYFWALAPPLFGVERSLRQLGRFTEARTVLQEVVQINHTIGDTSGLLVAHIRLAENAFWKGWRRLSRSMCMMPCRARSKSSTSRTTMNSFICVWASTNPPAICARQSRHRSKHFSRPAAPSPMRRSPLICSKSFS